MTLNEKDFEVKVENFLRTKDKRIVCSNCGTINSEINSFCTNCKERFNKSIVDKIKTCPKCSSNINSSDNECQVCGYKLVLNKSKNDNNLAVWIFIFIVISLLYFVLVSREGMTVRQFEGARSEEIFATILIFYVGLAGFYWVIYWLINSDPVTKKPKPTTKTLTQEIEKLKQQVDMLKQNKNIDEVNSHKVTETITSKNEKDIFSNK